MNEGTTDGAAPATRLPEARDASYTQPHGAHGGAMTGVEAERVEAERVEAERRAELARTRREPLTRTERLLITMFVTMFAAMLGAGALGFTAISGQLLDMQQQIGELRTDMQKQIGGVQTEIGELRTDMQKQIGGVQTEIGDLRTDMQNQIGELSERMARVETLIETRLVLETSAPPAAGS